MKEFKAVVLIIVALLVAYLSTIYVPRMWVNVGLLELGVIVFVFYAVWNVNETFGERWRQH